MSDHSMEPVAWCDDRALAGSIGNTASAAAKRYWEEGHPVDRNSAKKLCHPLYSAKQLASLERQLAAEKERADYAWRNTNTIEKARQEEMAKREVLTAALEAVLNAAQNQGPFTGMSWSQVADIASGAIAKVKP